MIQIDFKENIENHNHKDCTITFPMLNRDFSGDTYWFRVGLDEDIDYSEVIKFVISNYKEDYENIKNLNIRRSYFWFFHFFDQYNQGVLITKQDNSTFKLNFVIKCTDYFEEFIFEEEQYLVDRGLFIKELKQELMNFNTFSVMMSK